jgi:hypothetical protein
VDFGNKNLKIVNKLANLGVLVTPKNDVSLEIQRRIQTAYRWFCGLRKYLRASHLARQSKLTIYKTFIHPLLLYGSETWVLTKREENRLLVFERKILRTIYGQKIVDGVYRSRYNFNIDREFNSPNVIGGVVKSSRLRYAGPYDKRAAVPEGRRTQGRPKSRWANGVNSDSRAFGARDWSNFARAGEQWRDILRQALTKFWL